MRAVVQRVSGASVTANGRVTGQIGPGLLILLAVHHADTAKEVLFVADKCVNLRIFEDEEGKMNRSLLETGGAAMIVSQFTLYGDCRKGRRPSFIEAAPPAHSEPLYESFLETVKKTGINVQCGLFGATMAVELINDGPVTLIIEKHGENP